MEKNIENCTELLQKFNTKETIPIGEKLQFSGVGKNDVYNISRPFLINGKTVITGRVEMRNAIARSYIYFFECVNNVWGPVNGAPTLPLEDGFFSRIGGETIIGGVEVYPDSTPSHPQGIGYRTIFYRGHDLTSLKKFAVGPDRMKDIRLIALSNDRIGVCTRPQGGTNGGGKIGYIELSRLEDINPENLLNAKIIENQFISNEWGGANELHLLEDGQIGVIGHIACRDEQNIRHYYAMSFVYNPKTHLASPIKLIATRKNFPLGDSKTAELADVIFPGGIICHFDNTVTLYAGLSDAEAGCVRLPNPFC
ncbi:MAG: DUF1861 family protein [Candidatus Paceibacterota bacterium]|jgi:hypothetical protein